MNHIKLSDLKNKLDKILELRHDLSLEVERLNNLINNLIDVEEPQWENKVNEQLEPDTIKLAA